MKIYFNLDAKTHNLKHYYSSGGARVYCWLLVDCLAIVSTVFTTDTQSHLHHKTSWPSTLDMIRVAMCCDRCPLAISFQYCRFSVIGNCGSLFVYMSS